MAKPRVTQLPKDYSVKKFTVRPGLPRFFKSASADRITLLKCNANQLKLHLQGKGLYARLANTRPGKQEHLCLKKSLSLTTTLTLSGWWG
jgi:hypothetical protein